MICFHCGKEIDSGTRYQLVGIDIPYVNLYFHKPDCWNLVGWEGLNPYLALNVEKIYNYINNTKEKGRK